MISPCNHRSAKRLHSPSANLRAFTMAEVLFAIIILGIGLILIAAAFPVGISQSAKVQDSASANLLARHAYGQITGVPAAKVTPYAVTAPSRKWDQIKTDDPLNNSAPVDRYATDPNPGSALAMAFLDGTMATTRVAGAAVDSPDLRAKVVYPASFYAEVIANPLPATWTNVNPTWADDGIQDQDAGGANAMLGIAAYSAPAASSTMIPVPFLTVWGFRPGTAAETWDENVQWVYPADRRYYWYAFYRQMHEPNFIHPLAFDAANANHEGLLARLRADYITRRTYRVSIIACKAPEKFSITYGPAGSPTTLGLTQIQSPAFFRDKFVANADANAGPQAYVQQWLQPNPQYPYAPILGPVRVPETDTLAKAVTNTELAMDISSAGTWLKGTYPTNLIKAGIVKRGGIVIDAWQNAYQIVDLTDTMIRLDRAVDVADRGFGANNIRNALPLWFNPRGIAVFPTIVVKQAERP